MKRSTNIEKFKKWIEKNGGVLLAETNDYELIRAKCKDGTIVVYRGKRGLSFNCELAEKVYDTFSSGKSMPLATRHRRTSDEETHLRIIERDGKRCWYCNEEFTEDDPATLEHLLSVCHGGSNSIMNKVRAHGKCNKKAGNLSVPEKVLLREKLSEVAA